MKQNSKFKYDTVMLIDDDPLHSFITEKLLKSYLFSKEVIVYASPVEALEYLKEIQTSKNMQHKKIPPYIFLDIYLPIFDGIEFLREFEKLSPRCHSKIVILTAIIDPEQKELAKSFKSVIGWISKPISEEILVQIAQNKT